MIGCIVSPQLTSSFGMLHHAMLHHATPCHAMLCHAMPCHAMLCLKLPCNAILLGFTVLVFYGFGRKSEGLQSVKKFRDGIWRPETERGHFKCPYFRRFEINDVLFGKIAKTHGWAFKLEKAWFPTAAFYKAVEKLAGYKTNGDVEIPIRSEKEGDTVKIKEQEVCTVFLLLPYF